MDPIFLAAWGCLLGGPVAACRVARRADARRWRQLAAGSAGLIAAIALALAGDTRFVWPQANILALCAAYAAYCLLAFSCLRLASKPLRVAAMAVAALPIAAGYVVGTIGFMGLGLIIADVTQPPTKVQTLEGGLVCRVTEWGGAFSDSGVTLSVFRPLGPVLEQRMARHSVSYSTDAPPVGCADLAK